MHIEKSMSEKDLLQYKGGYGDVKSNPTSMKYWNKEHANRTIL